MLRSGFMFVLHLVLVLKVCNLVDSTISKPFPRCRAYKVHAYNKSVPSCDTATEGKKQNTTENFPHIALLIYRHVKRPETVFETNWACHGTLVSSRYLLSTAYCLKISRLVMSKVRFGATSDNFLGEPYSCDYDIESKTLHPLYNKRSYYNNIGLIKLARKVEFSKNIRPICLPHSDLINSSKLYLVNYESTITRTLLSLTKNENTLLTNEECNATCWNEEDYNFCGDLLFGFTDDLFCLRKTNLPHLITSGKSGAPIFIDQQIVFINDAIQVACSHVQLGILNVGTGSGDSPVLATNVYHFMDWIENIIWADGEDM